MQRHLGVKESRLLRVQEGIRTAGVADALCCTRKRKQTTLNWQRVRPCAAPKLWFILQILGCALELHCTLWKTYNVSFRKATTLNFPIKWLNLELASGSQCWCFMGRSDEAEVGRCFTVLNSHLTPPSVHTYYYAVQVGVKDFNTRVY